MRGWEVKAIATMCVTGDDSMMFQTQGVAIAGMQAASAGIPWLPILTSGDKEEEMGDLEEGLRGFTDPEQAMKDTWPGGWDSSEIEIHKGTLQFDAIVSGALRSDFQKTRIEQMCERLDVRSFCPLWHNSSESHMDSLYEHDFDVRIASVSSEGLGAEWLGASLGKESVGKLKDLSRKYRFNIDGEGGEFETLVLAAPHMQRAIQVDGDVVWEGRRGVWNIKYASLTSVR